MVTWHGLRSMIGWRSHDPADLSSDWLKITWSSWFEFWLVEARSHDPADLSSDWLKITWYHMIQLIWMLWLTWRSHDLIQVMWLVENHILQEVSYSLDSDEVMKDIWEPTRNDGNIQEAMRGLMRVGKEDGGGEWKTSVKTNNLSVKCRLT